ncbi:EAL domain-containing protein, partial [uncultured Pseudokineococcus sp.]|uniref:EAL domain-containing protein n=1 Tax=uncultured Pseudokineococcus sp. TaxID=1642928 RepID=UPI002610201C
MELTERSLAWRPSELLHLVARVRELGWAVALDDVGQDPLALALLPVLQPEVVKLDLALARRRPDALTAQVVVAVAAYAERTGAVVVAEGLETPEHVQQALAMGASLGQGYLLGRPGPLERRPPAPAAPLVLPRPRPRPRPPGGSAFALVADRDVQRSTKPLLEAVSRHLEAQALTSGPMTVLLAALQHSRYFGARTAARYRRLASSAALVAVLGEGMAVHPTERVRGALLEAGDPLLEEWVVAVVNPHFTAALVAREVHGSGGRADESPEVSTGGPGQPAAGPDAERVFEYVITYERELVLEVAARLLMRVTHGPDGDPRSMASAVVGPVTDTTVAADTGGPDYRRAFTEAPVGMALVTPEGGVMRANRELELLLSPDPPIGRGAWSVAGLESSSGGWAWV